MTTTSAVDPYAALNTATSAGSSSNASAAGSADRFLKLLVAQMQNQDPLNPMDNAQITSQMAQINTVNGIQTLNTTVQSLSSQFAQLQALQGAALVGHDVTVPGKSIAIENGVGVGGYELAGPADRVKLEVLDASGRVVDTLQLGAQESGRHEFEWPGAANAAAGDYSFRITANSGTATVSTTTLMRDRVDAVSTDNGTLMLELARSGAVEYSAVKAFN
ncbi:MAG: flagellar hook assembly protein FlgD [Rubrivivax sp.]